MTMVIGHVIFQGTFAAPSLSFPASVPIPYADPTHDVISPTTRDASAPSGVVVVNADVAPTSVAQLGPASLEATITAEAAAFEAAVETNAAHLKPCVEATAEILDALVGSSRPKKVSCILAATVPQVSNPKMVADI